MRPGLTVVLFFAFKSGGRGGRGTEEVECEYFLVFCLACFELYTPTQTSAPHKCVAWPSGLGSVHMHRAWKDKNVKRSMGPKQIWPKGEAERRRRRLPPFATSALPCIKTIMPNTAPVHEIHLHHFSKPVWSDCMILSAIRGRTGLFASPLPILVCLVDKRRSLERSAASRSKAWPAPPSPPPCAHAPPSPPIDLLH